MKSQVKEKEVETMPKISPEKEISPWQPPKPSVLPSPKA